jgi:hypothetical protein
MIESARDLASKNYSREIITLLTGAPPEPVDPVLEEAA